MLWFALIIGLAAAGLNYLLTRDLKKAARAGGYTLLFGIAIALILTYSGLMGG